ncbi:MAG: alpha/beta fold hydrolase [Planctomycetota bacterium]|nr:MAG: alpha/beta fold hydrolase [Planctomycetota bacterium]
MPGPTYRIPGLVLTDHEFPVPLDHAHPEAGELTVFAREVVAVEKEGANLPWLVFLQGGPGFAAPRPFDRTGWVKRATEEYRVLMLDQRGTGRSSPVSFQSLARLPSAEEQAEFLRHFRSDSIVADAEWIRRRLLADDEPWTVLGQSYGGFCATHYLSQSPAGLRAVLITGGLPPLDATCEDIYRRTYPTVARKNRAYYERYPGDVERVQAIVACLVADDVRLPCGDRLTPRRFQQLGLQLGFSDGFEILHYLFEDAFVSGSHGRELSYFFLRGFEHALHFDTNPIFSVLHEACYTQQAASRWAAERVRSEFPEFEPRAGAPVFLTGEMIYPWMFAEIGALRPLADVAEILAQFEDWPRLYDPEALSRNSVPCAAAVYYDDMYVDRRFSLETAEKIPGVRPWITNEYEHNGLRAAGEVVLDRLLGMVAGRL